MYLGQRVIYNGIDISREVNDWRQLTATFAYTVGQTLFVGSESPFNNIYFDLGTVNDAESVVSTQIWWANDWQDAVDVIDETSESGVSLAKSGRITFRPHDLRGWDDIARTRDQADLSAFNIYDYYWVKFTWDEDLNPATVLKYVGQKFSDDGDLYVYYPDLNNTQLKAAHSVGKTNWNDQHFAAAEFILRDMISRNLIWTRGQLLDASRFLLPSVHKVAEIIYASFGTAYENNRKAAQEEYKIAMNMGRFAIDLLGNAKLENDNKRAHSMFQTR